jgi:tetratricopeptide (TPR) repeat protein
MGDAFFQLHLPDSAKIYWDLVSTNYRDYPGLAMYDSILAQLFLSEGEKYGKQNNYRQAIRDIKLAVGENPRNSDLWYNLGGAYFSAKIYDSAYYYWQQTLKINPNNAQAKQGLTALTPVKPANKK